MSGLACFDEAFDFGAFDVDTSSATFAIGDAVLTALTLSEQLMGDTTLTASDALVTVLTLSDALVTT